MTKHEMAVELAERMNIDGFGVAAATHAIDNLTEIVTKALENNQAIYLRGFATIKPVVRKARKARNISAGKIIEIPASKTVKFQSSKALVKRLNS